MFQDPAGWQLLLYFASTLRSTRGPDFAFIDLVLPLFLRSVLQLENLIFETSGMSMIQVYTLYSVLGLDKWYSSPFKEQSQGLANRAELTQGMNGRNLKYYSHNSTLYTVIMIWKNKEMNPGLPLPVTCLVRFPFWNLKHCEWTGHLLNVQRASSVLFLSFFLLSVSVSCFACFRICQCSVQPMSNKP